MAYGEAGSALRLVTRTGFPPEACPLWLRSDASNWCVLSATWHGVTSMSRQGLGSGWRTPLAFDVFYREEYGKVLGLAIGLSGDRAVAEELVQEAFEAAWRRWASVSRMEKPGSWVRRVVSNRSVSSYRRAMTRARYLSRGAADTAWVGIPDEAVDVVVAIRRLPPRQAQAVWLRYFDDLTVSEVAEIMGCEQETVKTHLARGLARLKEHLGER